MVRHLYGRRVVAPSEGGQSMNITSTRRADEFNRLLELDGRTDDPVAGPMLAVAEALRAVPMAEGPRPEFRTALRQRLVAVATVQGVGATEKPLQRARAAGSSWKVQRRLTALAAGAAVVTGVTGVGLGASRSLPGQPFYGVKRATEGLRWHRWLLIDPDAHDPPESEQLVERAQRLQADHGLGRFSDADEELVDAGSATADAAVHPANTAHDPAASRGQLAADVAADASGRPFRTAR